MNKHHIKLRAENVKVWVDFAFGRFSTLDDQKRMADMWAKSQRGFGTQRR